MQKMPQTGRVAGMDQRPVQAEETTAYSVATFEDSEKDPIPNSYRGIDLADKEIQNQVEDKTDRRVDQKAVDTGLEAHIDTGAAALEVDIDKKIDLGVHMNTGVDPGAHIGSGVDLEEGIVP